VIAKRKGVVARRGLKEAWSKRTSRCTRTRFEAYGCRTNGLAPMKSISESPRDHYPVLVVTSGANEQLRVACLRWSICLVEPTRIPLPALAWMESDVREYLQRAGCPSDDVRWACLPFNRRYPPGDGGILVPFGPLRAQSSVEALLRFQRIATLGMDRLPRDRT
jgi:hypothetical protein